MMMSYASVTTFHILITGCRADQDSVYHEENSRAALNACGTASFANLLFVEA